MPGRLSQSVRTVALAAATVFAVVPAATVAVAAPLEPVPGVPGEVVPGEDVPGGSDAPGESDVPGVSDGPGVGDAPGPSAASDAFGVPAAPAASDTADRSDPLDGSRSVAELLTELRRLYQQAEEAGETYKATDQAVKEQRREVKKVTSGLSKLRFTLAGSRGTAGRLAREQYQGRTELSPYLRLLLAKDPQYALHQGHVLQRAADDRAATISRLESGEKRAVELARTERRALGVQQALAKKQKEQRDAVGVRLKKVEALLASLTEDQLADLAVLETRSTGAAQRELVTSGALGSAAATARPPSKQGGEAVEYAVRQLGKPYVWGAEGPASFDCSGLTSQAWAHAGRTIPRTSQEQWRQLPKVSLRALRPGDLVIYFPKATHVAIYLGKGMVVQAPRPDTRVKVSPIASNPLLGAVRPDPLMKSLDAGAYAPPALPREAVGGGSDAGYGEVGAPGA
ncbi:C40 family peptidase [Streptomyces sp. H27-C3]|uniref:C40 family peptidase n=1 Tax=Streptomyces sp. H27-C3 TaxID=3046305 RepID=UPI0024BB7AF8|nr:C40 family peptidase [Streptomyces sp. H27-C3]MDJ0462230.1 NlpC/P60 family protein [Streptomyces sp. H27-C3]